MGGAISHLVNTMTTLSLAQAVLGDEKSVTRAVDGQSFQLICVPESMGGGYLLFSHPDAAAVTIDGMRGKEGGATSKR